MMKVIITSQQKMFRINTVRVRTLAIWLARQAGLQNFSTLEILLIDDAGSAMANGTVFGRDYVTDVISLAYSPLPGEAGQTGELIINIELAAREGVRRTGGPDRELALYLAHGCDHLAGADDATPRERATMRRREVRWMRAAARAGLLQGFFPRFGKQNRRFFQI